MKIDQKQTGLWAPSQDSGLVTMTPDEITKLLSAGKHPEKSMESMTPAEITARLAGDPH